MNILIAAVGKIGRGPEAELADDYLRKTRWKIDLKEIPDAPSGLPAAQRKEKEAAAVRAHMKESARLVAFDSTGEALTSKQFAQLIARLRQDGAKHVVFAIGGQDGLDAELLKEADRVLAFGKATWPHKLARAMLAEQLYRAYTISIGHPYHEGH